jgi:hypothetical protein
VAWPSIRPITCVIAATVAAATLWSGDPDAYALHGSSWPQPRTSYFVNAANQDNLSGDAAIAAVRAGAEVWQQQSGAFRFEYGGPSTLTVAGNDAINLVLFRNASSGSAIATAYWWTSGSRILEADIVFWDAAFRFFAGSSGCTGGFYIEDIAAHEFGHALGLGHSTASTATMYPSAGSCDSGLRQLDGDDIAGVRALYPWTPPPPTPPTGLRIVGGGP